MRHDPLIDEVREAWMAIWPECGQDIHKLCARYQAMEQQMKAEGKGRFVSRPLSGPVREAREALANG